MILRQRTTPVAEKPFEKGFSIEPASISQFDRLRTSEEVRTYTHYQITIKSNTIETSSKS